VMLHCLAGFQVWRNLRIWRACDYDAKIFIHVRFFWEAAEAAGFSPLLNTLSSSWFGPYWNTFMQVIKSLYSSRFYFNQRQQENLASWRHQYGRWTTLSLPGKSYDSAVKIIWRFIKSNRLNFQISPDCSHCKYFCFCQKKKIFQGLQISCWSC
jgi:hypothetical protein